MAVCCPTINGTAITYDEIGNPLTYRDDMSFTWNGRQMATANLNGTTVTYKYDADGLRNYKKVGNTIHEYEYVGGQLVYEKRGDLKFYYRYNAMGELASIKRIDTSENEETSVYVVTNTRGDIEELRLASGTRVARYVYDTWGNVLHIYDANGNDVKNDTTHIGVQNPFRYRSYYYDAESGLYYLQSRYYDPVTCRFVNADGYVSTGDGILSNNMYAYCENNPVKLMDLSGNSPIGIFLTILAVAAIVYINNCANKKYGSDAAVHRQGNMKKKGYENKYAYIESEKQGANKNGVTVTNVESGVFKNTTKVNNNLQVSQSVVSTQAVAEADFSGLPSFDLSGYISAYTLNYDFSLDLDGFVTVNASMEFYVGGISGGIGLDIEEGKVSVAPPSVGLGYKWDLDVDWS